MKVEFDLGYTSNPIWILVLLITKKKCSPKDKDTHIWASLSPSIVERKLGLWLAQRIVKRTFIMIAILFLLSHI